WHLNWTLISLKGKNHKLNMFEYQIVKQYVIGSEVETRQTIYFLHILYVLFFPFTSFFNAKISSNKSLASPSVGSCGTSSPLKALCRMACGKLSIFPFSAW